MTTFRGNILESPGDLQLCAGQCAGYEAAVHALSSMFSEDDSHAILLVDADNSFNRINRNVMLHNTRIICPIIATYVINSDSWEARLFISGLEEITSAEDTTQGDCYGYLWHNCYAYLCAGISSAIKYNNNRQHKICCVYRWYKLCSKTKEYTNLVE